MRTQEIPQVGTEYCLEGSDDLPVIEGLGKQLSLEKSYQKSHRSGQILGEKWYLSDDESGVTIKTDQWGNDGLAHLDAWAKANGYRAADDDLCYLR